MRVLVIEDNESVCSMIEMFFLKEGIEGVFVHDGLEGYERAKRENWDLLIVDWMLPGMDGVSICRKIREMDNQVPIIMLTAKDSESEQVLGLEMGADDYVTKPFSPLALMARIKAVTRRARMSAANDETDDMIKTKHFKIIKHPREVFLDGEPIAHLTPKEFDLLVFSCSIQNKCFPGSKYWMAFGDMSITVMNGRWMYILNDCVKNSDGKISRFSILFGESAINLMRR